MLCDDEEKQSLDMVLNETREQQLLGMNGNKRTGHMCIPGDFIAGDVATSKEDKCKYTKY